MALVPFRGKTALRDPDDDPDRDENESEDDTSGKMSFLDHLDELRKRIIWAVASIGIGFLIAFLFIQRIFDFVMKPLQAGLPAGGKLIYTEPTEAFILYIQMALIAGVFIASPLVMYQVWLFIAPGLYSHEKKLAIPFVVMSSSCFILGAAFSHFVIFPMTWQFFVSFTTDYMTFMPRIEPTFNLYIMMLLAFGLVFQMPVIVLFLARMGLVTAGFLFKNFKYAILIIFIIAAVVTPSSDMWNQSAMALPMIGLYIISIGLAWMFGKQKRKADEDAG